MIFAAVGTQLPFPRMIKNLDEWAYRNRYVPVVAQTADKSYQPIAIKAFDFIEPKLFSQYESEADLIVGHCGMGVIIGALTLRKPLIVMPRLLKYGEHRNDHQLATARLFHGKPGVYVAFDENEFVGLLSRRGELTSNASKLPAFASAELLATVREFIASP